MKKLLFLCLALLSILGFSAFRSQEDPIMALLKKLEEFTKKYPSEKVYLHLDKPYYAAGDNIWFKAYVTDWKTGSLTTMSSVLHVELIDQYNNIGKRIKLPMQNGLTWGDFKLSDTLSEGHYRIRAYTQWMRNAGPNFFFDKTIKIGNNLTSKVFTKSDFSLLQKDSIQASILFTNQSGIALNGKKVTFDINGFRGLRTTDQNGAMVINLPNKPGNITLNVALTELENVRKVVPVNVLTPTIDVQFLPEGGTLLEGVKSKLAIKAIGTNGLGVKVKGKIVDQTGTEVSTFETSNLGMGAVYFVAEPNKTYTASIAPNLSINIPKAEKSGYSIAFSPIDSTKFMATVKISSDLLNKGELNLVAQKNGLSYSLINLVTTAKTTEIVYETKDLPQGIVQFTLFSPSLTPVCERVVFVNNHANTIHVELKQLKPNYAKKEKVDLSFISSSNSKPIPASFSVSVTNADVVTPDLNAESNILANLLLTSELTGHVESPNTYFSGNDVKTREALDHLMLTQGWRKINWKFSEPIITHPVEKGLKISGVITKNDVPVPLGPVSLVTNKDGMFKIDTISNQKGEFTFENLEFTDSTRFIVQARTDANKKDVRIGLNFYPEQEVTPSTSKEIAGNVNQSLRSYLNKSETYFEELAKQGLFPRSAIALKEVVVQDRKSLAPNSKNLNGPGNADQVIDVSQLGMANSVAQYLQGRVANVTIKGGTARNMRTFKASLNGTSNGPSGRYSKDDDTKSPSMHVILDGVDMGSTEPEGYDLHQLNPQYIESIEVLTSLSKLAVYGPNAARGLIIVTTKKGSNPVNLVKYAPGVTTFIPKGYYASREFYSPKYDVAPSDKPDLRTTVFWAPNLVSDETGNAKFDYFNTDQQGNYRIVIEGIDINGNLARKIYTYKVN